MCVVCACTVLYAGYCMMHYYVYGYVICIVLCVLESVCVCTYRIRCMTLCITYINILYSCVGLVCVCVCVCAIYVVGFSITAAVADSNLTYIDQTNLFNPIIHDLCVQRTYTTEEAAWPCSINYVQQGPLYNSRMFPFPFWLRR